VKLQSLFFLSVKPWLLIEHVIVSSFCLEPEDIKRIRLAAIWRFSEVTGLP
jgi:hypothetical protein